jgi:cell division protein FtsB
MPQNPTDFGAFINWGFYGFLTVAGGVLLRFGGRIAQSVEKLNVNIAVMVERLGSHEKAIGHHDERFEKTEERFTKLEREVAEVRGGGSRKNPARH